MVLSRLDESADSSDNNCIRTDALTDEEAEAVRAVIRCFRAK
jgi:hypothetical protein